MVTHTLRRARTERGPGELRTALTGPACRRETGSRRRHTAPAGPEANGFPSALLSRAQPTSPPAPAPPTRKRRHLRTAAPPAPRPARRKRGDRPRLCGAGWEAGGAAPRVPAAAPARPRSLGAQSPGQNRKRNYFWFV